MQRATGSPVYYCKIFYPSLNKVVIVIIIVIVTVNHSYYCYYYKPTEDNFHRSYFLVFFTLILLVEKGFCMSVCYDLFLIYKNANVLKTICHMHSRSPLNLMIIFK